MTKAIGHAGLDLLPERQREIEGLLATGRYGDGPVPSVVSLVMDRTTLGRNLKVLSDRGLLEIGEGDDRRYRPITITARGQEALELALPLWEKVQTRMANGLGHDRWAGFLGDLNEAVRVA